MTSTFDLGTGVIALVRHGDAGNPHHWDGPDRLRPLNQRGVGQAADLAVRLQPLGASRILSSPFDRCVQTVAPLARALGLDVERVVGLSEGHEVEALELVRSLEGTSAVLCSHGDVIPAVLSELVISDGLDLGADMVWSKGSAWLLAASNGRFRRARYLPPSH